MVKRILKSMAFLDFLIIEKQNHAANHLHNSAAVALCLRAAVLRSQTVSPPALKTNNVHELYKAKT